MGTEDFRVSGIEAGFRWLYSLVSSSLKGVLCGTTIWMIKGIQGVKTIEAKTPKIGTWCLVPVPPIPLPAGTPFYNQDS